MPRKSVRRSRILESQPVLFSPFGRLVSRLDFASMTKHHMPNMKHRSIKHPLEEKSDHSESSAEEVSGEDVQADFAFFDPKPCDFHGVKTLLQTYLDDKEWDLSGFIDLIIGQTTVGSVVKIEDDEDGSIFSVVSALNIGRYMESKCITDIKEFLLKACNNQEVKNDLKLLLGQEARSVGLLLSQHVTNLPPQLLPPLYDALFDEVTWATEDEPTKELRDFFRFKVYLLVSKIYKRRNTHQKKGQNSAGDEEIIYVKSEDELFQKLNKWSFSCPLHKQNPIPHELKNYQPMFVVMAVEADKISTFRHQLHSLINDP